MYRPCYDEVLKIAAESGCKVIPISREIFADVQTPVGVLRILKGVGRHCYLLESASDAENWGRYTFLGYNPSLELTCTDGRLTVRKPGETPAPVHTDHPGQAIKEILSRYQSPRFSYLPPFTGGLVGYFSYDYIKYAEPSLCLDADDEEGFQDVDLMLFENVIAFDHYRQKIILIANMKTDSPKAAYEKAKADLDEMAELILTGKPVADTGGRCTAPLAPLFDKAAYCRMVERAKQYIREGDIFQVVLSNRLSAPFAGSLLDTYRVLRTTNPSPYMFYFSSSDVEIAGASPETLVKLKDGVLHTFPLAGTRPRGGTDEEDKALEAALLQDEKELAEHNMLVDLGRNDLGKISRFGSVEVEKYCEVLRFSHVMHLGSTVRGAIRADRSATDAIDAVLPAGTLSGAPKLRACEIINALENNKRGIYGGAIGYLDFTGNLDTCIAIRLAFLKNGRVFVRSGAGIVADSVPEHEYQECINKAKAVVEAIAQAEGGAPW